jgi:hypothetical protein
MEVCGALASKDLLAEHSQQRSAFRDHSHKLLIMTLSDELQQELAAHTHGWDSDELDKVRKVLDQRVDAGLPLTTEEPMEMNPRP